MPSNDREITSRGTPRTSWRAKLYSSYYCYPVKIIHVSTVRGIFRYASQLGSSGVKNARVTFTTLSCFKERVASVNAS